MVNIGRRLCHGDAWLRIIGAHPPRFCSRGVRQSESICGVGGRSVLAKLALAVHWCRTRGQSVKPIPGLDWRGNRLLTRVPPQKGAHITPGCGTLRVYLDRDSSPWWQCGI